MLLLDVNVVVAGFRDDHPQHPATRRWLDELFAGETGFGVAPVVWASFLRLVTNRRVFPVPTPRDEAFAYLRAVRSHPNYLDLGPGPRHFELMERACEDADARGDLVPDAVLAAIAVEHDCEIVTMDRDFARFRSVRHRLLEP